MRHLAIKASMLIRSEFLVNHSFTVVATADQLKPDSSTSTPANASPACKGNHASTCGASRRVNPWLSCSFNRTATTSASGYAGVQSPSNRQRHEPYVTRNLPGAFLSIHDASNPNPFGVTASKDRFGCVHYSIPSIIHHQKHR